MDIVWDESKNKKLRDGRGVSFEDVAQIILEKKYLAILENPARPQQRLFVVSYKGYTYAVPFVIDEKDHIILKTVFPSRKFHKLYGEKKP
ncbi:MAG: hypothetical protein HBSIN02_25580 [Bacteroidia bacterium]|nr:MAG: hypothetical protein HBSIN02_25580 [Bacteroidia bacterium]